MSLRSVCNGTHRNDTGTGVGGGGERGGAAAPLENLYAPKNCDFSSDCIGGEICYCIIILLFKGVFFLCLCVVY